MKLNKQLKCAVFSTLLRVSHGSLIQTAVDKWWTFHEFKSYLEKKNIDDASAEFSAIKCVAYIWPSTGCL